MTGVIIEDIFIHNSILNPMKQTSPPHESRLKVALLLILAAIPIIGGPMYGVVRAIRQPAVQSPAEKRAALEAAMPKLDLMTVATGKRLYEASCVACHGVDGRGVPNLGRDLVNSRLARRIPDGELLQLIIHGRKPGDAGYVGPIPMPPRGGRDDFSDEHIAAVVSYVRALQVPSRVAEGAIPDVEVAVLDGVDEPPVEPAAPVAPVAPTGPVVAVATPAPADTPGVAATDDAAVEAVVFDADTLKRGKRVYNSCIACHGKNGAGIASTGADLIHSSFVRSSSNDALRDFIKSGRAPGAPGSVMNLNMPAKGGNPALKDNQIDDVVIYIRSLQQSADGK